MKLLNGNIDQLFKEKLSDYEATASDEVWSNIERDLHSARKKPLMPVLLRVAAAVILLVGIGGLIVKYSGRTPVSEQITEEKFQQYPVQKAEKNLSGENKLAKIETNNNASQTMQVKNNIAADTKVQPAQADQEYIASVDKEKVESLNNIPLLAQNSLEPDIENTSVSNESEIEITNDLKSKAVPVYQSSQVNSYAYLYTEETKSKKDRNLKWSVGGQAGPQYTYRDVIVSDAASQNFNTDEFESGIVTYAGGFNVQLGTSRRFTIQSGVYYSKIGTNNAAALAVNNYEANAYYTPNDEVFEPTPADIPNSTGSFTYDKSYNLGGEDQRPEQIEADDYTIGDDVVQEYFEYLEIPLVVRFKIVDRKLGIDLNGGLWTNFLINFDAVTNDPEVTITEQPDNINKVNYSGSLGIGFDYPITNSVLFNLEPIFKYYLSPINNIAESKVHPYTFGVMAGIRYSF